MKKLDSKATVAGVLLLLNAILWFVQVCVDYTIRDGGFWGVGGMIQQLFTVELADIMSIFFLAAMFIAAITLLTRNRVAAVIGLLILAAYYVYSMSPWDIYSLTADVIALVVAIVFTAIAVAVSDDGSKPLVVVTTVLIVLFAILHVVVRSLNGGYDYGFAGMPVTIIYAVRYLLLALALFCAARVRSENKGAHTA